MGPWHGKLLFLVRQLGVGGAERQLVLLARRMHDDGHAVTVATYYPGGAFQRELEEAGVNVHCLEKRGRWDLLGFIVRLLRWICRERPTVVYGYLSSANLLLLVLRPALKARGVAVACSIRASEFDLSMYDWPTRLLERLQRRVLRFADVVICNSVAGRDLAVAAGADRGRCFVIENGIDAERFQFVESGRERVRRSVGVTDDEILVGMVARQDPVKGYEDFIAAAAEVARRYRPARFIAAGSETAGYSESLRDLVQAHGLSNRWIWAGHVDDLAPFYSALDVFCLSSTSEGFPNAVGEAMSCGLPCVVTDVGDSARILGDVGWVVPARTSAALAAALSRAIDALPKWDPHRPRYRIQQMYGVDRMANKTVSALSPWLLARS